MAAGYVCSPESWVTILPQEGHLGVRDGRRASSQAGLPGVGVEGGMGRRPGTCPGV